MVSAKNKARGKPSAANACIEKGSLIYIKSEGSKNSCRDRYIVVDMDDEHCIVQKFVKSQLRSKRYQLKLTEVYPVIPDSIVIPGDIRGLEEDDTDDVPAMDVIVSPQILHEAHVDRPSIDDRSLTSQDDRFHTHVNRPSSIVDGPSSSQEVSLCTNDYESSIPKRVDDCSALQVYKEVGAVQNNVCAEASIIDAPVVDGPRRSSRQTSKPRWMENYVDR